MSHPTQSWIPVVGARPEGARLRRMAESRQFREGRFQNLPVQRSPWAAGGDTLPGPRRPEGSVEVVPLRPEDFATPPASGLRATWMGHASALLEIDGARVLVDPVWAERCSPVGFLGPKRFHGTPIALEDLPPIDVVVISHDHYDHLDMAAIRILARTEARFAVPLGVGAHLEAWGVAPQRILELDWHEGAEVAGLRLTAAPAQHFSGRGLRDRNRTLWASWVIEGPRHRVFFGGDSGYFDGFKAIGTEHGPFDLTLLGIGAYSPMWAEVHMNPEEAVQAHLDLRGDLLLPIHWGTFNLAFHGWQEPAERLLLAAEARGVRCALPRPGEGVEPKEAVVQRAWWRTKPEPTLGMSPAMSTE